MARARMIIVGFGNIGRGLAETLVKKEGALKARGLDLAVVAVCEVGGCVVDESGINLNTLLSGKAEWGGRKTLEAIENVEADIVVELTPGNIKTGEPGLTHIKTALESGKHVVTSNKSPLAVAYSRLTRLASRNGLQLRFEATVGGAIPVISTFRNELKVNSAMNIYGILNGTTNYILSKMSEEGVDLQAALKEAQDLGLAESNPEYDINGTDTAAKVVILANALMGMDVRLADIRIEGIKRVTPEAIELAKEYGYTIKLVGDVAAKEVGPMLVPIDHPLNVRGSLNAILIETDIAGKITMVGHGAGPRETSSALMADIIAIAECL